MSTNRMVGVVLLVVGVAILIYGVNASHSVVDHVSDTFTGRFTEATTWYIIAVVMVGFMVCPSTQSPQARS